MSDEPDNVISLVERLQKSPESEQNEEFEQVTYEGLYPLFEGHVIMVSGEVVHDHGITSTVDFLPKEIYDTIPEITTTKSIRDIGELVQKYKQRAEVPFSVNPAILNGACVRAYMREFKEGALKKVYTLEVTQGSGLSPASMKGFSYIKIL